MNIGLYGHGLHHLTILLARELRDNGVEVTSEDCLCKYDSIKRSDLQDIMVIHPADDNKQGCWDKIREAIIRYEDIRFYVFAYGKRDRQEGIGNYPNLQYIHEGNASEILSGFMKLGR